MTRGGNTGRHLSREEREAGIAFARAWRIENTPYFDALYPETAERRCRACDGRGTIRKDNA